MRTDRDVYPEVLWDTHPCLASDRVEKDKAE